MLENQSETRSRFLIYSCFAITLVAGISGTLLGPAFQSLSLRFTIPLENSGIFTGLQFLGITISVLATGRLLDRINARYALMCGSVLIGLGLLLIAVASSVSVALLGTFVLGLGYGIADVGANVVIARLNPERTGAALSRLAFFYGLGAVLGPQLINIALSQNNFTLAFIATAVISLLLTIPFSQGSLPVERPDGMAKANTAARIHWWVLLPFALVLFTYVGVEVGFSSWIVTQISMVNRITVSLATIGASLFWLGLTVSRGLASLILRRLTESQVLVASMVVVLIGLVLLLVLPSLPTVAFVSAFIVGFGCGPIFPTTLALAGNVYPESRGTTSGVMMAVGTLGGALLPWVQGQIGAGKDGGMGLVLIVALAMICFQYFKPQPVKSRSN